MVNVRLVTNYAEKRYHVGSISAPPCATKVHAIRAIRKLQSNADVPELRWRFHVVARKRSAPSSAVYRAALRQSVTIPIRITAIKEIVHPVSKYVG